MNKRTVHCLQCMVLGLILTACQAQGGLFTWDGGGGAGNEGWSYTNALGKYVNWTTDPAAVPGASDYFKITGAGALSLVDADFLMNTPGANSSVTATSPGATLEIPSGKTLTFGGTPARVLTVGAAADETGTILVKGTLAHVGHLYIAGIYANAVGTLTVTNGVVNKSGGNVNVGSAAPNAAGTAGPRGTLNLHNGTFNFANGSDIYVAGIDKSAGSTLTSVGVLDLRNGSLLIDGRSLILGSTNGSGIAVVCGNGKIGKVATTRPLFRLRVGTVTADGDNVNRDLDISECTYSMEVFDNANEETNGWYATEKGRLLLPSTPINSGANYLFGENTYASYGANDLDPDFVNSVAWSNITYSGTAGSLTNQGALLALDRDGLTLPAPANGTLAVWEFLPNKAITSVARLVFRFDHARAASLGLTESMLKLFTNTGSGWSEVAGATVDEAKNQIIVTGLGMPAGTNLFAIGSNPGRKGSLVIVR